MKDIPIELTARQLFPARIAEITRMDGTAVRIAEAQSALTIDGDTFGLVAGCEMSAIKHTLGGDVPSMEIAFAHAEDGTFDTEEVVAGLFDGADVLVWIVDRSSLPSTLGTAFFTGTVQTVQVNISGSGSFEIKGQAAQAETFIPTYQPMCRTDLGSTLCGVDIEALAVSATVASIVDRFTITLTIGSPPASDYFNQGVMVSAAGHAFEIASWDGTSTLKFYLAKTDLLSVSEAVTLYPGCDKTVATCASKFSNTINFQGEPHFLGARASSTSP